MGLINEEIEVTLGSKNIKYYEDLGYEIPRIRHKYSYTIPKGSKIKVLSKDLKKTSCEKIHCECDICGKVVEMSNNDYNYNIGKNNGKFVCRHCAIIKAKQDKINWKYKIGQRIITDKKDITIIDRKIIKTNKNNRTRTHKYYRFICNKCGFDCGEYYELDGTHKQEFWLLEDKIERNGCSCCSTPARIIVPHTNTIDITNPELVQYFKNKEDTYKHLKGSRCVCEFKCPICGKEKEEEILTLYSVGNIGCTCGDGFSYPEKFMMECLNQIGIAFIWQLTGKHFKWIGRKRYDFYFELNSESYIIETNGKQHPNTIGYSKSSFLFSYSNRRDEQKNDDFKRNLAIKNGIKEENYISIDCSISEMNFIKNNIINSKIGKLFDLSNINWNKCDEVGFKNIIKQSCEMFNNGMSVTDIMKEFNVARTTICGYLNIGTERNWCNYNGKEEQKKRLKEWFNNNSNIKPLIVYEYKTNKEIGIFKNIKECIVYFEKELSIKLHNSSVYKVINGEQIKTKGYTFKLITNEEYFNKINNKGVD